MDVYPRPRSDSGVCAAQGGGCPAQVSATSAALTEDNEPCLAGSALIGLGTRWLGVTVYACPLRQCAKVGKPSRSTIAACGMPRAAFQTALRGGKRSMRSDRAWNALSVCGNVKGSNGFPTAVPTSGTGAWPWGAIVAHHQAWVREGKATVA